MLLLLLLCTACALQSNTIRNAPTEHNQAVVFDIDGTLTPRPFAIFTARDDAAEAVQLYADQGIAVVYLTARVTMFQSFIPGWLEKHGFPDGSIHVTQSSEDRRDHAAFKERVLNEFRARGWAFVAAYGDSSSDFEAYAAAGINKTQVFALQRDGEDECQAGIFAKCLLGWGEHLAAIGD